MNKLVHELWHDLRAKRLWPVAVLLLVALVAVPTVLKKKSDSNPAPAPAAAAPSSSDDSSKAIVVADNAPETSTLGVFNKKDPFKPDKAVLKAAQPPKTSASSGSSPSQPSGGSSSGSTTGGGGSSNSTPPSGGSQGGSGGNSGGSTPTQPTKPQAPKGPFAYTVDVRFGKRGETRLHHNVQKLDVLPNENNPLLVFMGVNSEGTEAVFLTDTSLKAAGEGKCRPSGDTCSFLYLKLGKNQNTEDLSALSADGTGTEYTLTLEAIHKVPVSELAKQAKKAAKAARADALRAHFGKGKKPTPFRVPLSAQLTPDTL
jgi:hypothetical protein